MTSVEIVSVSSQVRESAYRTLRSRQLRSRVFLVFINLGLVVAFAALLGLLFTIVKDGYSFITPSFFTHAVNQSVSNLDPRNIGGIGPALAGSAVIDALALIISIPIAIGVAMALFQLKGRVIQYARTVIESLIGIPSILFGLFVYMVLADHSTGKGIYGSIALSFVMVPVMTVNALEAFQSVDDTLIEAGLALGINQASVLTRIVLPTARQRVLTGVLLAFSRGVGETAPLIFVVGFSLKANFNPMHGMSNLPMQIYGDLSSYLPYQRAQAWGIALVLMTFILILNIISRTLVSRQKK